MYEKFLKLLRKKHLTVYRVSKMSGIPQSIFSDWKKRYEEGKDSKLSIDNLKKLADALDVQLMYFLEE